MDNADVVLLVSLTLLMVAGIAWIAHRRRRSAVETTIIAPEVQKQLHQMKNEAAVLRAGLRRIADSEDPLDALVRAITRNGGRDK